MSDKIITSVRRLITAWKDGRLGGEVMPEDVHPPLPADSKELMHYFTLTMALNYQRNSYTLWQAATSAFNDPETAWIFTPEEVVKHSTDELKSALLKHKVALQPINHIKIWSVLCNTIVRDFNGDARNIISKNCSEIEKIKSYIAEHKKDFPYLGGPKICNYWLYVLTLYMSLNLTNRAALTIAPDTHVINASIRLGVIPSILPPQEVADKWAKILNGTELCPIDIHTPLWLWSRANFHDIFKE